MDKLTSSYSYERWVTTKNIGELKEIDEQFIFVLRELAISDPDKGARRTAKKSLATHGLMFRQTNIAG